MRSGARIAPGPHPGPADREAASTVLVAHPSADLYGSDRVMVDTVRGLRAHGHRVVVTVPAPGPLTELLAAEGVEVVLCPTLVLRKNLLTPRGLVRLLRDVVRATGPGRRLLRHHRVDVVLVNTLTIPWWLVLAKAGRGRRYAVGHVHEAERSAAAVVRRLLAAPLLLADHVVVNSVFSRDVLIDAVPRLAARTTVVPNAVPGPAVVVPARPTVAGPLRLLFVGRLSARKGPDVAIAALAALVADGVDATLDVVGAVFGGYEGFETGLRESVRTHRLGDRVRFHGFDPDVWPHLAACDVVLVPSTVDEPFGNTAVEAMLAARPAVVSATSGLLEAAAGFDAVVLVPPADPAALADAIRTVLTGWPTFRAAARADADTAAARHAPGLYSRRIEDVVSAVSVGARAPALAAVGSGRP